MKPPRKPRVSRPTRGAQALAAVLALGAGRSFAAPVPTDGGSIAQARSRGTGAAADAALHKDEAARLVSAAREALAKGDLAGAEALARRAITADDALAAGWRVLGLAAFRAGRYEAAESAFVAERARETEPGDLAVTAFNLAGAAFKRGRFADAESDYLAATKSPALLPLATLNAGIAAESDDRLARAVELYRAAEKAAAAGGPGSTGVSEQAALHLADVEEAARAAHRDEAWRLGRAGSAALKAHRPADAVSSLSRALAEADAARLSAADRADLEYADGHALLEAGRPADAAARFRRALAGSPRDPEFHYMLAAALDRAGDDAGAAVEFKAALSAGLAEKDAARARAWLAERTARRAARFVVETQVSAGYDSHYLGGREAPFRKSLRAAGASQGAPEILVLVEPRLRLLGTAQAGLVVGDRLNALLYASSDADPYSLIEDDLYLEATYTPRDFVTLTAIAEGYVETAGIASFGLYQAGAQLSLRAVLLEGDLFTTRLRYAVTYMHALQDTPPSDYRYMTGFHHEATVSQSIYPGPPGNARFSFSYTLALDDVGTQAVAALDVLGDERDAMLRRVFSPAGLIEPLYSIPYSYLANTVSLDGEGDGGGGVHLAGAIRYEHRDYFHEVRVTPDPGRGYHTRRADDRLSFELSVRREVWRGLFARAGSYLLFSRSTINNDDDRTPYDFDDKNYVRFVGTLDLLKNF